MQDLKINLLDDPTVIEIGNVKILLCMVILYALMIMNIKILGQWYDLALAKRDAI